MIKRVLDLKLFREKHNIKTQNELAEKLHMPLSTINKYELNGTDPEHNDLIPLSFLIKISDIYQVKIDDILTEKQFIDTNNPLVIESDFYMPVHEKQSKLCLPLNDYWKEIENDSSLDCDLKKFIKYLISNEVKYFCSIYHKPVVGFVSKYKQDSILLIQRLLGEELCIDEEFNTALNDSRPVYFVYTEEKGRNIQYYKCKNDSFHFPDIRMVFYSEFAFNDFEIANKVDYSFSVCYVNNPLLKQITITKFEYINAKERESYFSKYQNFYACDVLILAEKVENEWENDDKWKSNLSKYESFYTGDNLTLFRKIENELRKEKEKKDEEKGKPVHDCSIYTYEQDNLFRIINDINTRKSISISAKGGEDISPEEYKDLKEQLHKKICGYYELKNKFAILWIEEYIKMVNKVLRQVLTGNPKNPEQQKLEQQKLEQLSKVLRQVLTGNPINPEQQKLEQLSKESPKRLTKKEKNLRISNTLSKYIIENIELKKIHSGSKVLLESIQKESANENNSCDCSLLKDAFALDMEFIFGYQFSCMKDLINKICSKHLNDVLKFFEHFSDSLLPNLSYFSLLVDIERSINFQRNGNQLNSFISLYSMNYSFLTLENLIHYISYQILSIYNSKAFNLAGKVKFYHKTDLCLPKMKKIIKTIKETDIESEEETKIVNEKIENAVMCIKKEFDNCMENFNYIQKDLSKVKPVVSKFISLNEELLKTDL